jgi:hypothetical protein
LPRNLAGCRAIDRLNDAAGQIIRCLDPAQKYGWHGVIFALRPSLIVIKNQENV